jgi:hypothetical protein
MNDRIELHFSDFPRPQLLRTVLMSNGRSVVACESNTAAPGARSFRWGRGMRSLCLALLQLRLSLRVAEAGPLLAGGRGSAASTLDSLIHKADLLAWLRDVLEISRQDSAKQKLQAWFECRNSQLNARNRPVRVFAGRGILALPPHHITVYVGNRPARSSAIRKLAGALTLELGGLPTETVEIASAMPVAGEDAIGRAAY